MSHLHRRIILVFVIFILGCANQEKTDYTKIVEFKKVMTIDRQTLPKGLSFDSIDDIAVDSKGNIYTSENSGHHIIKFDQNGKYLLHFGALGQGPGEFMSYSIKLAVDRNNNIYLTDNKNGRVQKFDPNGNFLDEYPSFSPHTITLDDDNNLYIWPSENNNYMLTKYGYKESKKDMTHIIKQTIKPEQLWHEHCLLAIKDSNLYIVSNLKRTIYLYDLKGEIKAQWKIKDPEFIHNTEQRVKHAQARSKKVGVKITLSPFLDIALDPDGNLTLLYLWEDFTQEEKSKYRFRPLIYLFTPQGEFLCKFAGISNPISRIAYGQKGNFYTINILQQTIDKYAKPN